jgi:hypothetical protein
LDPKPQWTRVATSAGAFTFAKKEAARLSVNNFDFASRAAIAVLACMTNPFYPNRSPISRQSYSPLVLHMPDRKVRRGPDRDWQSLNRLRSLKNSRKGGERFVLMVA